MDDPFGPIIIIALSTLLAAIVRLAAACLPFLDEGELRRQAEGDSPRAKRAVRLIERNGATIAVLSYAYGDNSFGEDPGAFPNQYYTASSTRTSWRKG